MAEEAMAEDEVRWEEGRPRDFSSPSLCESF
jgi:hypothetical protein